VRERLSLLLPVWQRDRPEHLTVAFRSTVIDQTRPPDHVVVVRDGPVAPALADRIADLAATSPVPGPLAHAAVANASPPLPLSSKPLE